MSTVLSLPRIFPGDHDFPKAPRGEFNVCSELFRRGLISKRVLLLVIQSLVRIAWCASGHSSN